MNDTEGILRGGSTSSSLTHRQRYEAFFLAVFFLILLSQVIRLLLSCLSFILHMCYELWYDNDTAVVQRRRRNYQHRSSQIVAYMQLVGADLIPDEPICCICYEMTTTTRLMPCGHAALCFTCCTNVIATTRLCPLCRCRVDMVYWTDPSSVPLVVDNGEC